MQSSSFTRVEFCFLFFSSLCWQDQHRVSLSFKIRQNINFPVISEFCAEMYVAMGQWHSFVSGREELRIICMIHLVQCAWGLIKSTLMFTLCGVIFATTLALVVHTAYIPWHWVASVSAAERVFSAAVCGHAFKAPTITISLLLSQPLFQLRRFSQSLQCAPFQAATSKIGRVFTKSENWWLAQWWIVLIIQI